VDISLEIHLPAVMDSNDGTGFGMGALSAQTAMFH